MNHIFFISAFLFLSLTEGLVAVLIPDAQGVGSPSYNHGEHQDEFRSTNSFTITCITATGSEWGQLSVSSLIYLVTVCMFPAPGGAEESSNFSHCLRNKQLLMVIYIYIYMFFLVMRR